MKNITKTFLSLFTVFLFFFFFTASAQAVYFASGDSLTLAKDKKIDETTFIAGSNLTIDSDINGDLLCAGKDIVVNGNIKGDILCAGQTIKINGVVDGNVRIIAQSIDLTGLVSRNVYALSQSLSLAKFSSIKGDLLFGVQNIDLRGSLGRDLAGGAQNLSLSGSLARNALVTASKIALVDPGKIGGNLEYYIDQTGTTSINPKNIKGTVIPHEITRPQPAEREVKKATWLSQGFGRLYWILSSLLLGFTLLYFFKPSVEKRIQIISQKPVVTALVGFASLILTPLVCGLLLMTVFGAPLALVLFLEYLVAIILAVIAPMVMVGKWVLGLISKKQSFKTGWSLFTGAIFIGLFLMVPVFGPLASFLLLCLGLGATYLAYLPEK